MADKRWNNLRHQFELTLTPSSIIRPVTDTEVQETIPDIYFNFVPLREVTKRSNDAFVGKKIQSSSSNSRTLFHSRRHRRDWNH